MSRRPSIAVEAMALTSAQKTGVGLFTQHLVDAVARARPDYDFVPFYYSFLATPASNLGVAGDNVAARRFKALPGRVSSKLLKTRLAPYYAKMGGLDADVYFFPNFHTFPLTRTKPIAVLIHDLAYVRVPEFVEESNRRWLSRQVPLSLARATRVVVNSGATRDDLVDVYDVDPATISVVAPGVDTEFYRPRDAAEVDAVAERHGLGRDYILFVGTVEPRKNLVGVLDAYERLEPGVRSAHELVIVGARGWLDTSIRARIETLSGEARVSRLGYVDARELPALYSGAAAFVYPSRFEGFGMPVLEAMACGTPVVTADNTALPEAGGDAALYAPAHSPEAIAAALGRVLTDGALHDELAHAGLVRAREFTWARAGEQLGIIFDELLNESAL